MFSSRRTRRSGRTGPSVASVLGHIRRVQGFLPCRRVALRRRFASGGGAGATRPRPKDSETKNGPPGFEGARFWRVPSSFFVQRPLERTRTDPLPSTSATRPTSRRLATRLTKTAWAIRPSGVEALESVGRATCVRGAGRVKERRLPALDRGAPKLYSSEHRRSAVGRGVRPARETGRVTSEPTHEDVDGRRADQPDSTSEPSTYRPHHRHGGRGFVRRHARVS